MGQSSKIVSALLARRSVIAMMGALLALGVPGLFLVRSYDSPNTGTSPLPMGLLVFLILAAVVLAVVMTTLLAGVDPDANRIAEALAEAPDQQRLLARWLLRTRWARNVGGLAGLTWWTIGTQTQGGLLVLGLGGVALGSMGAQLHQARRMPGLRTATLDRRTVAQYSRISVRRRMIAASLAAVVLGFVGLVHSDSVGALTAVSSFGALMVLAATWAIQRRVAGRPRPALTTDMRRADDMARILAIGKGLAEPGTFWAVALMSYGVVGLEPAYSGWSYVVSTLGWFYALGLWWDNRRLGLDHILKGSRGLKGSNEHEPPGDARSTGTESDPGRLAIN
ncbi:MAG: hypothetical protein ACRBK7_07435 [Acidimicrobiales bacterium]